MKTKEMTNEQKKAKEFLDWFEVKERDNGDKFLTLKDGRPEELQEAVHLAHDGMLPDDYKYDYFVESLEKILDYDDMDDIESEIEADCYNSDLLKWLSSNLSRAKYVEEYVQEFGIEAKDFDLYRIISGGQYLERSRVFNAVRRFIEKVA